MNVLFVYLGRKGGSTVYSLEMAKELNKKVELLIILSKQLENIDKWREANLNIIEVDTYTDIPSFIVSTMNIKKFISIRREIKRFNPDVAYYPMIHRWSPIINCILGECPIVTTLHDPTPHLGEENVVLEFLSNLSIKQSTRIILLSKIFINTVEKFGVNSSNIDVIPHGEFSYYSNEECLDNKKFHNRILFFGRISKYKGVDVLVRAFKELKKDDAFKNTRLLIVGNGNLEPYNDLIENTQDIEIINRWISDEEVSGFFNRSDFLVAPYIDASQSGVIQTAFGFALPVISTRVGGIPEQIEDGETGFIIEPNDVNGLVDTCKRLLINPDRILEMGRNAYLKSQNELSWDNISNLLIESLRLAQKERKN